MKVQSLFLLWRSTPQLNNKLLYEDICYKLNGNKLLNLASDYQASATALNL